MRSIAFVLVAAMTTTPAIARPASNCGQPNARLLVDVHALGTEEGPQIVVPNNGRLNLEVSEEAGITAIARDRKTGENIFGSPPHGAEPYYLTPW